MEKLAAELELSMSAVPMGTMIRHPLVQSIIYNPSMNDVLNNQLEIKKKLLEEAAESGKWNKYCFLYERPYRTRALSESFEKMDPKQRWRVAADVWTDSENIFQNMDFWSILMKKAKLDKNSIEFMNESERLELDSLPDTLEVYRGYDPSLSSGEGLSYSLDKKVAEFFASRFCQDGRVLTRKIKKAEIFALKNSRGEREIILFPG